MQHFFQLHPSCTTYCSRATAVQSWFVFPFVMGSVDTMWRTAAFGYENEIFTTYVVLNALSTGAKNFQLLVSIPQKTAKIYKIGHSQKTLFQP